MWRKELVELGPCATFWASVPAQLCRAASRTATSGSGNDSPLPRQRSIPRHETWCKLVFSVHKYQESLYQVWNISLLSNFTHLPHFKIRKSTVNVTSSTCFVLTASSMTRRLWSFKRDCGILHIHAHTQKKKQNLTNLSHCFPVSPAGTLCRHVSRQAWKHQRQNISEDTQMEVTFLCTEVNRTRRNQRIFPDLSL